MVSNCDHCTPPEPSGRSSDPTRRHRPSEHYIHISIFHLDITRFQYIPLKHECHATITDLRRLKLCITSALKRTRIWTMRTHDIVQTSSSRLETASSLRIVVTSNQAHKLRHCVTVIPWWTESILLNQPARRENDEVRNGCSNMV